jgi:hypothetical protein
MTDETLQFDRAERTEPPAGVTCTSCHRSIADRYYSFAGRVLCEDCARKIEAALAEPGQLGRGILLGIGGGIVGGAVYYAVAAISGYEIGLIAILVGWLVGRGMQRGSRAAGGRRYQLAAVIITYLAIAGSYAAFALRGSSASWSTWVVALAAAPLLAGFANPPGSLLSLLIIGIGLLQAWRMNQKPRLQVDGPFQIAPPPAPAPGPELEPPPPAAS